MCILNFSKLVSVLAKNVIRDCVGVARTACLISKARHNGDVLHRRFTCLASHHQNLRLSCYHSDNKRYYSDLHSNGSESRRSTFDFVTQEETDEMESNTRQKSKKLVEEFSIDVMMSLLRQENAVDICVIKVPDELKYTDFFIVVSGVSPRHLSAMALYAVKVYKFMKKDGDPHVKIEGKDADDWMCIDFGSIVVHFMLPETRELYELEKLWTLRSYDEQLQKIPPEKLPEDFIYGAEVIN